MCNNRLLVWYTVITALFRCPSSPSELTARSSQICKPYLTGRSYVTPYVGPYYTKYAAPYVDSARPYVDRLDKQLYSPSMQYGTEKYQKYAAPHFEKAQQYGQNQWQTTLRPQLEALQLQVKNQYDSTLAPQLDRASATVAPYYTTSRNQVLSIYNDRIIPAYTASFPYAQNAYSKGHDVAMDIGLPYAKSAWDTVILFLDRALLPKVRILYGENVEPQVARIRDRLGRYRDGKKMQSVMEQATR